MKRLLITAFIGSSNLGDQAIFKATTQKLQKNKSIQIAAFTLDKKKHTNTSLVRFIQTKNPFKIIKEIYLCDLLVIGGGGIIQDTTTIYNLLRHTYKALIAICFGKKYMFYAVGVDELRSLFNKALAKFIFNMSTAITVRDNTSKKNLELLGVSKEIVATADPVVSLVTKKINVSSLYKKPYVIVCLRHWFDINRYIPVAIVKTFHIKSKRDKEKYNAFVKIMAEFLDGVVERYKYQIIFLPFFDRRDDQVHSDVLKKMKRSKYGINFKNQLSIDRTAALIGGAEYTIGMRLHSLILSAMQKTPFIALNYSQKVTSFVNDLSLREYGVGLENLSSQELQNRFARVRANKDNIKDILRIRMKKLQEKEKMNNHILKRILFSG